MNINVVYVILLSSRKFLGSFQYPISNTNKIISRIFPHKVIHAHTKLTLIRKGFIIRPMIKTQRFYGRVKCFLRATSLTRPFSAPRPPAPAACALILAGPVSVCLCSFSFSGPVSVCPCGFSSPLFQPNTFTAGSDPSLPTHLNDPTKHCKMQKAQLYIGSARLRLRLQQVISTVNFIWAVFSSI